MTHRRSFLLLGVSSLALGACQPFLSAVQKVADVDVTKAQTDISTIAGAVTTVKNVINSLTTIPQSIRDAATNAISKAQSTASSFASAVTKIAAAPLVTELEADLNAAFTALSGSAAVPTSVSSIFSDALTVLGAVKTMLGIASLVALAPSPAALAEARLHLQAAALGRLQ